MSLAALRQSQTSGVIKRSDRYTLRLKIAQAGQVPVKYHSLGQAASYGYVISLRVHGSGDTAPCL
jgi:hypothetical protein